MGLLGEYVLMVDAHFWVPRLAQLYDALDPVRSDLDAYVAMVAEFGADTVLDIGCGTGVFACQLVEQGVIVVGVDPAVASLDVARRKPSADAVRWIAGDATGLPALQVAMVTMTGNVGQVFLSEEEWYATLTAARGALRPGGRLIFETRDPSKRDWEAWTREQSYRRVDIVGVGRVETWVEVTEVALPLVGFRTTFVFDSDGAVMTSDSTLRFRDKDEVAGSLETAGFVVEEIRDAPDRPGLEMVFIAAAGKPLA